MQEVKGITIVDAFKALDDISDDVVKEEVKKVRKTSQKKTIKESVQTINISGKDMYDKGQAYYYARTGDHVDYNGNKFEIVTDKDGGHKIGYSDTILLKGEDGNTIEVSKKDFINGATLLKEDVVVTESQEDYYVLSDGANPKNSQVFSSLDNVDDFIATLESKKADKHWELLHYVNGNPTKIWDSENGRVEESCNLKEEPVHDMAPEYDSRKSFYGKAKVDERPDGTKILYSYGTPVCKITKDGKATLLRKGYLGWASSQTTLRHVKEFLKQNGLEAGSINDLRKNYPIEQFNEDLNEGLVVDLLDKDEVEEGKKFIEEGNDEHIEQVVDVDADTVEELKDSYVGNVLLRCPVCKTPIFKKPELLEKDEDSDVYNVGETCPHCGSKDGFELVGQIATLDIPQEEPSPTTGKDEIENSSATVEDELTNNEVGEDKVEDEVTDEEENKRPSIMAKESLELNGLSEDTFNTLVNKYLEATYNNVDKYTMTSCNLEDNKLIVEGVITFKSGNTKDTTFVLDNKGVKNNRCRFVGMNETFSKSKRTFNLVCTNDNGNLVCESLSYGYKAKDKEVKGKVKIK